MALPVAEQMHIVEIFSVLVSPDTDHNMRVPVLVDTNALDIFHTQVMKHDSSGTAGLNQVLHQAYQAISMRNRHLAKAAGVYGLIHAQEEILVPQGCQ